MTVLNDKDLHAMVSAGSSVASAICTLDHGRRIFKSHIDKRFKAERTRDPDIMSPSLAKLTAYEDRIDAAYFSLQSIICDMSHDMHETDEEAARGQL